MAGKTPNVRPGVAEGTVVKAKAFDRLLDAFDQEAQLNDSFSDPADVARQVAEAMLDADSWDEVLAVQDHTGISGKDIVGQNHTGISGKDIVGQNHTVVGFEVVRSTKEGSPLGYFLRVHATDGVDQEFTYAVGATSVVMGLYRARQLRELPVTVYLEKRVTASGNELLLLRKA
jgi:hypothetical protein